MQLYVKIQGALRHCTVQVKAKPRGIVAKNNLFAFMGPRGGWKREDMDRALQDSSGGLREQSHSSFPWVPPTHVFSAFFPSNLSTFKETLRLICCPGPKLDYLMCVLNYLKGINWKMEGIKLPRDIVAVCLFTRLFHMLFPLQFADF